MDSRPEIFDAPVLRNSFLFHCLHLTLDKDSYKITPDQHSEDPDSLTGHKSAIFAQIHNL